MTGLLAVRGRTAAGLALVGALAAGCGGGGSPASTPAPAPSAPVTSASPTEPPTVTIGATPSASGTGTETDLADGRHPVHIVTVDPAGRRVQVDVIQFFTGTAAATAAAQDHAPEVPPPNDVWIRNVSKKLRTLQVAPDAVVTVNTLAADQTGSATKDVPWSLAQLAGSDHLSDAVFWVTLDGGRVTRISQQYLP